MAPAPVDAPAAAGPSACLQASYRVCVRTSSEPANAGTCQPVWVELVGRLGSTGAIALDRRGSTTAFAAGASDVFQLEAPAVGDLQQLNIWVEGERGGGNNGSGGLIAAAGACWEEYVVTWQCCKLYCSAPAPASPAQSAAGQRSTADCSAPTTPISRLQARAPRHPSLLPPQPLPLGRRGHPRTLLPGTWTVWRWRCRARGRNVLPTSSAGAGSTHGAAIAQSCPPVRSTPVESWSTR